MTNNEHMHDGLRLIQHFLDCDTNRLSLPQQNLRSTEELQAKEPSGTAQKSELEKRLDPSQCPMGMQDLLHLMSGDQTPTLWEKRLPYPWPDMQSSQDRLGQQLLFQMNTLENEMDGKVYVDPDLETKT